MDIITDKELVALVDESSPECAIQGIKDRKGLWFEDGSPIQPCSIDLSIGELFLPSDDPDETALNEHILKPGQTCVAISNEKMCLPANIAGIGFPPSRLAVKGLLMTNPGHIDPGSSVDPPINETTPN